MAWWDLNWVDRVLNYAPSGPQCGHGGCTREAGRWGVCSRHKGAYGLPQPKNQLKLAQEKKEKAEARRQKRGG